MHYATGQVLRFMKCVYIMWGATLRSTLKVNRYFGGTYRLYLYVCLLCASCCYLLVNFQLTTRCCITDDRTLHIVALFSLPNILLAQTENRLWVRSIDLRCRRYICKTARAVGKRGRVCVLLQNRFSSVLYVKHNH